MHTEQVVACRVLDVKEIILGCHFAERDNFNRVGFAVRRVIKNIPEIPATLRFAHHVAQCRNILFVLRGVGHVHHIARVRAVLKILAAVKRCGLVAVSSSVKS